MLHLIMMVAMDAKQKISGKTLEEKIVSSMKAAKNHWMVMNQNHQFYGAILAVIEHVGSESDDGKRLIEELGSIKQMNDSINAAASGIPVAFENLKKPENPIGVIRLWKEVQDGKK